MAAVVGALRAILTLESAAFQKGLSDSQKALARFDKRMKAIGSKMQAIGAAVTLAGAGIAAAMKTQIDRADEMSKAAQKFGVSTEELSRLSYAAELSDVAFDSLGASMGRLAKAMVKSPEQFTKLGVAVKTADGQMRGTGEVLADLSEIFAAMPDGAEKTALAMQLFGKSGAEMIPMLNAGGDELRRLGDEADRLGITVGSAFGKQAETFNDTLTTISAALRGLVAKITEAALPTLQRLAEMIQDVTKWFSDLSPETRELIAKFLLIAVVAGPVIVAMGMVASSLGAVATALGAVAALALANPIGLAAIAIAAAAWLIWDNWDELKAFFVDLWASVTQAAKDAWEATKAAWANSVQWFNDLIFVELPKVFDAAWEAIKAKFQEWVDEFKQLGSDIMKGLADGILGSRDMATISTSNAMDGVISTAEEAVDSHSPSRVFQTIGHNIMAGLGLGIEEGTPEVQSTMNDVAKALGDGGLKDAVGGMKDDVAGLFKAVVDGGDAVARYLDQLANSLLDTGIDTIFGAIFGSGGGLLSGLASANGNVFSGGNVRAFANGGVVSGPTAFRLPRGMGVMGEAGPEAIMPLTRVGGKLGVAAVGGGTSIQFSVDARGASKGVDELIVEALRRETPRIVDRSVAAVAGAGRRGHRMGAA